MILTSRAHFSRSAAAFLLACLAAVTPVKAASISYPNLGPIPPGLTFTNIVESSGTDAVPLYGLPTPAVIGLNFTPTAGFFANSSGGGADLTDGQLNYTVTAGPGAGGIPLISFSESGTYTLGGVGPGTVATVGAILRATILEINGAAVVPINLAPINASLTYSLPANLGSAPWALSISMNVASQLAGLGYGPGQLATKAEVVINNALVAASTATSNARIVKGDFDVHISPEPSSLLMMGMALCGLGLRRSARKRN